MESKLEEFLDGRPISWLADKSGVHRNSISQYIHKDVIPKLDNAYKIANAFGKSVYEVWPDITHIKE